MGGAKSSEITVAAAMARMAAMAVGERPEVREESNYDWGSTYYVSTIWRKVEQRF
jgi:hypothetical protein